MGTVGDEGSIPSESTIFFWFFLRSFVMRMKFKKSPFSFKHNRFNLGHYQAWLYKTIGIAGVACGVAFGLGLLVVELLTI